MSRSFQNNRLEQVEHQNTNNGKYTKRHFNKSPRNAAKNNSETIESLNLPFSSDQFLEEVRKLIHQCEPNCSLCKNFLYQFSTHIRDSHSRILVEMPSPVFERFPPPVYSSSSTIPTESDIFVSMDPNVWFFPESTVMSNIPEHNSANENCNDGDPDTGIVAEEMEKNNLTISTGLSRTPETKYLCYCDTCGRGYSRPRSLRSHIGRVHKQNAFYKCGICHNNYKQYRTYEIHLRSHRPHNCEHCNTGFTTLSALTDHENRVHPQMPPVEEQKSHRCRRCGKKFRLRCQLISHNLTHTKHKPYKCETCGLDLSEKHKLMVHMRVHTGEKPFSCETCGMKFSRKDSLKRHVRIIHSPSASAEAEIELNSYICSICDEHFEHYSDLRSHLLEFHQTQGIENIPISFSTPVSLSPFINVDD